VSNGRNISILVDLGRVKIFAHEGCRKLGHLPVCPPVLQIKRENHQSVAELIHVGFAA
jgi:hypothetical protein